jgi:uncharacterized protein (TIGR02145 family)
MKNRNRIFICQIAIIGMFLILCFSCKKTDNNTPPQTGNTVTDLDGNVYHAVTIGMQTWMLENLKTTKYQNSDPISPVSDNANWNTLTTGAQCNYNNDAANGTKYGRLYNFYAVSDIRNIAPAGWHVATDADWAVLKDYLTANPGTSGSFAKAIAAKTDWANSTVVNAVGNDLTKNNSSGFTTLPAGFRYGNGSFAYIGSISYWWSSTESGAGSAFLRLLYIDSINEHKASDVKTLGFSVRCVRNAAD